MDEHFDQLAHAERIAQRFHEVYEEIAPDHGYVTRPDSRRDWLNVPQANKNLMIDTVRRLLNEGVIKP